ncbi:hypothetical protein [Streptomyces sp. STCH 565 A]|uniref:hypothetical protein n=1 Tax=Streptomyces sp. STCH 565 A TaxID=2950532 RepID=UPI002074F3AE|nr:hypothetical protein [Streptomyces sp. STCH 565 A]MCM8556163.1 hypothetical protein [Streptomyces sp. STCH 565 A]
MTDPHTPAEAVQYWYDAATERREERDRLRSVVARVRQMADFWEQRLPETIRTPAVVSALRATLEAVPAVPAPPVAPSAGTPRELLLAAIDGTRIPPLGYGSPEELLTAYDASRTPAADETALRDRVRRVLCQLGGQGDLWGTDLLEPDEYGEEADAVLAVLPATPGRAEYDALVAEADRLRRDGAALHAKAADVDTQLAALRKQVAAPAPPGETAAAVLAVVEAAGGDTLTPGARVEALAGITALLPTTTGHDTDTDTLLPVWEAVYEPGNVSDYLIGYANDQDPATGMAEAWLRSQAEVTGRLEWVDDKPLATGRYDRWFELIERHDDGVDTGPGIIVRRRVVDEMEPAAASAVTPPTNRAAALREAIDVAREEGHRLEVEVGIEAARGARCVAYLLRKLLAKEQPPRGLADKTATETPAAVDLPTLAAVLREAADDLAAAFGDPMVKHIGALGASHLRRRARQIEAGQRRMADETQPAETTPCSGPVPCEDGGEPCDRHEREQAHAEGEHDLCGAECVTKQCECGCGQPGELVHGRRLATPEPAAGARQDGADRG